MADIVALESVFGNSMAKQDIKNTIQEKHSLGMYEKVAKGRRKTHYFKSSDLAASELAGHMVSCTQRKWYKAIKKALDSELAVPDLE